jgi:hypothetical protein
MKEVTDKNVTDACAAYYRTTGSGPSRAGIRSALFYGPAQLERVEIGVLLDKFERTRLRALGQFISKLYPNNEDVTETVELLNRLADS